MKFRKKHRRRLLLIVILVLAFLFGLAMLVRRGGVLVEQWLLIKSSPAIVQSTDEAVQADFLFNLQPDSNIFSERIIQEINQAQKSLEIAMYAFTSPRLKEAVYEADRRGVKITIITDSRKHDAHAAFFADAPKNITRQEAGADTNDKTILMHHKFVLIDRGESGQKLLFGSYNWTDLQEKYDPSFLMVSDNSELINSFGREFDRITVGKSGVQKLRDKNYHPWDLSLQAAGYNYEVWFSPGRVGNGIKKRLSAMINGAQSDIKIMIWDFTDKDLAVDLIRRARDGVKITLITDTWNFANKNSVFIYLAQAKERYHLDNFSIILDQANGDRLQEMPADNQPEEGFDPFLHLHVLIVDDKQVLFGTNNWSRAGAFYNDESIMVSDAPDVVNSFEQVFQDQYQRNLNMAIID